MRRSLMKGVAVVSLLGVFLSLVLLVQHYQLISQGLEEKSFCSLSEWVDCDAVNASSFSEVAGIPVAGLSLVFYAIVFFYSLASLMVPADKKGGLAFCLLLSAVGLAVSVGMAYVSFFKLETFCIFCGGLYGANIFLCVLIPQALRVRYRDIPAFVMAYLKSAFGRTDLLGFKPRLGIHLGTSVLVFAVTSLIFFQMSRTLAKEENINFSLVLENFFKEKKIPIDTSSLASWGNAGGKVTIVDFSDFECPFCRRAAFNIKPMLQEYRKDVAFYYAHYPLDSSCNPNVQRPLHLHACNSAKAAICAGTRGKFWPFHDLVFENQRRLMLKYLLQYAEAVGLDRNWLLACMDSPETAVILQKNIEQAKNAAISGTPSVFVNGKRLGAWTNKKIFRAVIEEEIRRSRTTQGQKEDNK